METSFQRILLNAIGAALIGLSVPAWSAEETVGSAVDRSSNGDSGQVIQPELDRERANVPNIDSQDVEFGVYYGIISIQDFKTSDVIGASAAWHITEDFFFEGSYAQAKGDKTSFEELSGGAPLISDDDRDYTYYDISLGWNVFPGEIFLGKYAFKSDFYIIAGVGNTTFAGDDAFTINAGAGYRLLLTDWLAWRVDARDYYFERTLFGIKDKTHNLELRTGFSVFF
jgi:outer membrane beta-barrel protein